MKASSVPTVSPISPLDSQDLSKYTYCTNYNLFMFSRTADGAPLFLLHNDINSSDFTTFSGPLTQHDPIVSFAIAREVISKSRGLLSTQNFKYFLAKDACPLEVNELLLEEDLSQYVRPQKGFTPAIDDICHQMCDTPFLFQNDHGNTSYFVEIPMLDVEAFNEAARQSKVDFEGKYFSLKEIMDTESQEVSQRLRRCFDDTKLFEYTEKFIINCEPVEYKGHYAMISCDPTATTSMLKSLHYSVFRRQGEIWTYYRAYENELPTDEDLKKLKGILIPGSPHSAYETNISWYAGLFAFQRKVTRDHKHINLLCICFGAQSLAQALGGKVEKMNGPYIRGGETLKIQSNFYDLEFVKESGLNRDKELVIAESHGDHIAELPPGAVLQASSARTNVEIYTIGKNVMALQGHPEYNEIWTAGANFRITKPVVEDYDTYAKEYIRAQFPSAVCHKELLSVCFSVLKN